MFPAGSSWLKYLSNKFLILISTAQSAGTVEYTDWSSI